MPSTKPQTGPSVQAPVDVPAHAVRQVTINGEARPLDGVAHVAALVAALGLEPRKVAIELNRAIVPRSQYETTPIRDGDAIEIVHFIGGG